MAQILTANQLRSNRLEKGQRNFSNLSLKKSARNLNEAKSIGNTTIFLSHSHSDKEHFPDILELVGEQINPSNIYVDWIDEGLPDQTNGATASRLKQAIRVCDKFVLLASPKAIRSNWVNWELGFGDGEKYPRHIAIFPWLPDNENWENAEYLQIYSHILVEEQTTYSIPTQKNRKLYVKHPDGRMEAFSIWINSK